MDRREFLIKAPAMLPAALKVLTEKSEDQTAPKPISYPKGWGKKDGKFVYNTAGATSLEGKPIDFSFYKVGETAAKDGVFTPSSMKGKTWIMAGLFTTCASFCPNTVATAIELQNKIIAAGLKDKIGILLVDLDPVSDTPNKLRNYAELGESLDKGVLHVVTAVNNDKKHSPTAMAVIHALNPLLPMSKSSQGLLSASDVAKLPVIDYTRHDGSWKAFNGDGQRLEGLKPQSATADQLLAFAKQKMTAKLGPGRDR